MARAMLVFAACLVFWLLLSGHWDVFHALLGAGAAAAVAWWNREDERLSRFLAALPRLVPYVAWLTVEIVKANLQVARVVLDPRLPVDPVVLRVRAVATGEAAVTTYANSITLTPGTITLDVEDDVLTVHALIRAAGDELAGGAMAARVARVFTEGPE
jgi:multicomponent Na+:H+ antiporter subunit E